MKPNIIGLSCVHGYKKRVLAHRSTVTQKATRRLHRPCSPYTYSVFPLGSHNTMHKSKLCTNWQLCLPLNQGQDLTLILWSLKAPVVSLCKSPHWNVSQKIGFFFLLTIKGYGVILQLNPGFIPRVISPNFVNQSLGHGIKWRWTFWADQLRKDTGVHCSV